MFTILTQGFMLTMIFHMHFNQCVSGQRGYCNSSTTRSKSAGSRGYDCCDNFEDVNNTCIECTDGYSSSDGSPCQPCVNGMFGRRCVDSCHCKENESCDHIKGCLHFTNNDEDSYKATSSMQQILTDLSKANNDTSHRYRENMDIPPILVYLICSGFLTITVTVISAVMIHRKRRQHDKSRDGGGVINEEQHHIENIETDHYLTVM